MMVLDDFAHAQNRLTLEGLVHVRRSKFKHLLDRLFGKRAETLFKRRGKKSFDSALTEILKLVAEGLSNQEIGDRLVIAHSTVKRHVSNIYGKLQVGSRTQAVAAGRRQADARSEARCETRPDARSRRPPPTSGPPSGPTRPTASAGGFPAPPSPPSSSASTTPTPTSATAPTAPSRR